jgi:hypothetical protein
MDKTKPRSLLLIASALLMMFALFWLSVSLPFVYAAQQQTEKNTLLKKTNTEKEDVSYTTFNEEESESSNTLLEYITGPLYIEHSFTSVVKFFKCHSADTYFAFHPEFVSPPPKS